MVGNCSESLNVKKIVINESFIACGGFTVGTLGNSKELSKYKTRVKPESRGSINFVIKW